MTKIDRTINSTNFHFDVITQSASNNALIVNVKIADYQETLFSKLENKCAILKSIAIETAEKIKKFYNLKLNPIDSGVEWQGQFE